MRLEKPKLSSQLPAGFPASPLDNPGEKVRLLLNAALRAVRVPG